MPTVALLLLAATVLPAGDAPKKGADKPDQKLWAATSVTSALWQQGTGGDPFMIRFALVNDDDKAVDPGLGSSRLLVNGKELKGWAFIIGNGPRDARWQALPAGDSLSFAYALGDYFAEPGVYRVVWRGDGFESSELVFRVLPAKAK